MNWQPSKRKIIEFELYKTKKPISAKQMSIKTKIPESHTRTCLTQFVSDGKAQEELCPCCLVGRVYKKTNDQHRKMRVYEKI